MSKKNTGIPEKSKKLKLKTNDIVQVICGKDKGSTGKILSIDRKKQRLVVEGTNMITKHVKPAQNQEGRIEKKEAPMHYSNVLLYCKDSGKGERIKMRINKDGSKTRVFANSGIAAE